ncbi:Ku protein [Streptosporangium sp. NPDC000396]|uniref:Ku protein n=1 Tax=Streptosporangium sp. NPDC000396 TaxID=3366185 RepID=UPI0036C46717
MKATWEGIISFGNIDIPIALYKATEEHGDLDLHQVNAKDLASLPLPDKKRINVLASVDAGSIDPMLLGQAYYVGGTDPITDQWYVLFRDALRESGQVAVTKVTLGARESLAVLRAYDDLLVLQSMSRPGGVRRPTGIAPRGDITVRPEELKMAMHLMDILSVGFDLDEVQVHDDYP